MTLLQSAITIYLEGTWLQSTHHIIFITPILVSHSKRKTVAKLLALYANEKSDT